MYQRKNFAYGTVATAPDPAASGTSLTLDTNQGARFPNTTGGTYVCVVKAANVAANPDNAEVVLVTSHDPAADTFTITREQEGSGARTIIAGDEFYLAPTDGVWDQIDVLTTKGDILSQSAAGVYARLGVGTNGYGLVAASGETTGLNWIDLAARSETLTNKTLTSPVITTPQINDTSADHQYVLAVSELTADRTVTLPLLTGADEFVFKDHTQTLTNKTLTTPTITTPVLQGTFNGWILANETWEYASATTITVPSGAANKYRKGDKIKLTQTTTKYFYIIGVADTVLTITGGSSYSFANAAVSNNYYSHEATPTAFPDTFSLTTPTFTTTGTAFTNQPSCSASFKIIENICFLKFAGQSNATSGGTGIFYATFTTGQLPSTSVDGSIGTCNTVGGSILGVVTTQAGFTTRITFSKYDASALFGNSTYYAVSGSWMF